VLGEAARLPSPCLGVTPSETAPQNWEEIMRSAARCASDETAALSAHEIFEDAMYQVYGQTEILPVAMMGTRPQFAKDVPDESNKPATSDGSMRTTTSGSTESTTR
jgi:hypothetical protein